MQTAVPLACFLSLIRPPGIQFENALLQIAPVNKGKCPYVRDNNDMVFQLYTRYNPTVAHSLLIDDDERLFASNIDFNDQTVIYFHAFMETPDDGSGLMIREAYTHRGDTNVIMVDAQRLEAGPWYFKAAENTWYIGRIAAQFIDYLVSRGMKLSKTHLVGHSLGAQSAGVAGSSLKSGRVSRITGLDPALPLFNKLPLEQRLDPSDAEFVDVIHTDAGIFGFHEQVGHVDFYPNGGISPQPGCELEVVIPQQQLLPKCDNITSAISCYVYHLTPDSTSNSNPSKHHDTLTLTRTVRDTKHFWHKIGELTPFHKNKGPSRVHPSYHYKHTQNRGHREIEDSRERRHGWREDSEESEEDEDSREKFSGIKRIFQFFKNKKNEPVVSTMRRINTVIHNGFNFVNQTIVERNNYTRHYEHRIRPFEHKVHLDSESKFKKFFHKLFGFGKGTYLVAS